MEHGDTTSGPAASFDVVLRGYDRRQVEDHLNGMEQRLAATAAQASELRGQRDAAAARIRELEAGVGTVASAAPAGAGLEGFGARVEAILRVATDEAATLRAEAGKEADALRAAADRDAEQARQGAAQDVEDIRRDADSAAQRHAEAEAKLRSTFGGIVDRLEPLAIRLDDEATAARVSRDDVTSEAAGLHTSAKQQFEALWRSVEAVTAQMTAEADTRVDTASRHSADVREELALVRQVLASLGGSSPEAGTTSPATTTAPTPTGSARAGNRVSAPAAPSLVKASAATDAPVEAATGPVPVIGEDTPPPRVTDPASVPAPDHSAPLPRWDEAPTGELARDVAPRDAAGRGEAPTEEIRMPRSDETVSIGKGDVPRPAGR